MKMTRLNPDGRSYRIPLINGTTCHVDGTSSIPCVMGTIADRLGEFEKLGAEPEVIEQILKRVGYVPSKKKEAS